MIRTVVVVVSASVASHVRTYKDLQLVVCNT